MRKFDKYQQSDKDQKLLKKNITETFYRLSVNSQNGYT